VEITTHSLTHDRLRAEHQNRQKYMPSFAPNCNPTKALGANVPRWLCQRFCMRNAGSTVRRFKAASQGQTPDLMYHLCEDRD